MRFKYRLKTIRGAIGNRLNGERCRHSTWLKINTGYSDVFTRIT